MCVCSLPQNDQNSKTQSPRDLKNESLRIIWKNYLGSYGSLIARVYLIALKEPSDGSGHGNKKNIVNSVYLRPTYSATSPDWP